MTDILATMKAELVEGAEFLRAHYPDDSAEDLHYRALGLRQLFYRHGGWPAAITAKKAAEKKAAEKKAAEDRAAAKVVAKAAAEEAKLAEAAA